MNLPKAVFVTALLLGFSSIAFATQIDNAGGTFTKLGNGLQLSGAHLTAVTGLSATYDFTGGAHAGTTLAFAISAPNSGSTSGALAEWTAVPVSTFTFTDPTTSLNFSGSFSCSATAECAYIRTGANSFVFSGSFTGFLNGVHVDGSTAQLHFSTGNSGTSQLAAVPEVGTLGMVGMGLLGIAGFAKRKFSSKFSTQVS